MDERERIVREMDAADAIRASSQERIGGVVDAIRSDIYDKLIHHAWFGQYPQQYADDLYRYADKVQDAAMPEVEAPAQETGQEASMEAFYGAPEQEVKEPQSPAYEREMER